MQAQFPSHAPTGCRRSPLAGVRGLTLVETIIAIGILALTTMGGVASYYLLNRYAANLRNMADARALCQERIEDANTMTFRPSNGVVPLAPSADPTNTASKAILGAATYYSSTGAFTGGANFVTSTENIPVYTQSTGTAASNSANVTYTRKCTVTPEAYSYGLVPLNLVEFTVTVSYVFRGQTYTTSMSTMRGPD